MKKIFTVFIVALLLIPCRGYARKAERIKPDTTLLFATKDSKGLYMDIYEPKPGSEKTFENNPKPVILFVFGGGFINGERNGRAYMPWFEKMTDNGYEIISIDYRLGLKGYNGKIGIGAVKAVDNAIHMAVEDIFSATGYILENAQKLGIRKDGIVISGSSAGAIAVLQADYELCNRTSYANVLPADFRYAGVMSFSGAILSKHGRLKYKTAPAPTLMLHGTKDHVVNYNQIKIFRLGFFGTNKITGRFHKFGYNYNTLRYIGHGHDIAEMMYETFPDQKRFLENNVILKKKRIIDSMIDDPSIPIKKASKSRKELYGN
jgi:predicted esterase